jgi:hypothetical protein
VDRNPYNVKRLQRENASKEQENKEQEEERTTQKKGMKVELPTGKRKTRK